MRCSSALRQIGSGKVSKTASVPKRCGYKLYINASLGNHAQKLILLWKCRLKRQNNRIPAELAPRDRWVSEMLEVISGRSCHSSAWVRRRGKCDLRGR